MTGRAAERGNAIFYVFLAIALMAALTYAYVKDSRENMASQSAVRIAEDLFSQANTIRAAAVQCSMEHPQGGGNLDNSGGSANVIDSADNPNNPYPLNPSSTLNPSPAADDKAKNLMCFTASAVHNSDTGALISAAVTSKLFTGGSNQGRFLPPPPAGFTDWIYKNDSNGVYIQTTGPNDAAAINALSRLVAKFNDSCQASLNYNACGARCFTAWVQKNTCP